MNKLVAAVGLAALGASSVHAQTTPGLTPNMAKPWAATLTLRGFFDDNLNTQPNPGNNVFGIEASPSLSYQIAGPQTHFSAGYVYSFKLYDHAPIGQTQKYDQTHVFNLALEHAFSERQQLVLGDSFVVGQEPDFLRSGQSLATAQRISGDNIRNTGSIAFKDQFTRLFGIEVGYNNAFYDYHDRLQDISAFNDDPSPSGLLDRIEHTVHLDSRWVIQPETVGVFGYQFRWADYTGNEPIALTTDFVDFPSGQIVSSDRNYREHYVYVGVDQTFSPQLQVSARVGARYIDFYNDPTGSGNGWGPYAMLNLTWTYAQDSYLQFGLSQDISTTDLAAATSGAISTFTTSQETTVVYGSLNHRFTPRLRGSVIGTFQYGTFMGGLADNLAEKDYLIGVNLNYQLIQNLSAEIGYNYDRLDSDLPGRTFDRNRVYIGVTAGY